MHELFRHVAKRTSDIVGSAWTFVLALLVIVVWAMTGPLFGYSDTWQLVINTGTTIVTFLMVFLIQNTQNRESKAVHLKIDELIRANRLAKNAMITIENLSDEELDELERQFEKVSHQRARRRTGNTANATITSGNS
jgi:low affinity Fe/Cu permease